MQEYKRKIEPDEVEEFPVFLYRGEIIVVDRPEQVAAAVADLRDNAVLGFDTETKPSFKKGVVHQVGLLQLASKERVYLFRLNKCGLPYSLRELLVNEDVLKVGWESGMIFGHYVKWLIFYRLLLWTCSCL